MNSKILIIGDTHMNSYQQLPSELKKQIIRSDWLIHVGDYISEQLLLTLREKKGSNFKGVYGNADPNSIREILPDVVIIEINGRKIGLSHPSSGGAENSTKNKVLSQFVKKNVDIIIYGHTHEAKIEISENILLINPGKAYIESSSYTPEASYVLLTIGRKIKARLKKTYS
jgi:putative phosphoesterase